MRAFTTSGLHPHSLALIGTTRNRITSVMSRLILAVSGISMVAHIAVGETRPFAVIVIGMLIISSGAGYILNEKRRPLPAYLVLLSGLFAAGLLCAYLPVRQGELIVYYAAIPSLWIFTVLLSSLLLREWISHLLITLLWINGAAAMFLFQPPAFRTVFGHMLAAMILTALMIFYLQHLLLDVIERLISGSRKTDAANRRLEAALGEKEVLLKEVHHRVKNNLQIISSLLNLHAGSLEDEGVRSILKESQGRVRSMALVHEELYQSENLMAINLENFVSDLLRIIDSSFRPAHLSLATEIDIPTLHIAPETALPLGLILNELLTNIFKHAFSGLERSRLRIAIVRDGEETLRLSIRDWGNGLPEDFSFTNRESMGSLLIASLVEQLGGTAEIRSVENGTEALITVPYAPPVPALS